MLTQYRWRMQTFGGSGGGSAWPGINVRIEVVGGPVGEIERGEGGFTPNRRYRMYSPNIVCTCKRLAVVVVKPAGMCRGHVRHGGPTSLCYGLRKTADG